MVAHTTLLEISCTGSIILNIYLFVVTLSVGSLLVLGNGSYS